jgi:hypothetical protein
MHFTHVRNLSGILRTGWLRADSGVDRGTALQIEAADLEVKELRRHCRVPLPPYGHVADYVPFYFAPRSPMLYKLAKGSVPGYVEGQDPLVYLVSTAEVIAAANVPFLFSDGNCAAAVSQFYRDLALMDTVVDWPLMEAQMWHNTIEDRDRRRRRMAEFLVHERVPVACIEQIVARRETIKAQVERELGAFGIRVPVLVRPWWYFENV